MKITIECAWCGKEMGAKTKNFCGLVSTHVSHSICPACQEKLMSETTLSLQEMKHPQ